MSQAGIVSTSSGPVPPTVATSYVTDSGTAVPAANVLIVDGKTSSENNANGIITKGGTPATAASNEVDIVITNRFHGTVNTTNATPTTVASLDLTTIGNGVFTFDAQVSGFDVTDNEGVGYAIFGTIKNIAGVLSVIGSPDKINNEDSAPVDITAADCNLTSSGTSAIIQVTGIAAKTFHWRAVVTYVYIG